MRRYMPARIRLLATSVLALGSMAWAANAEKVIYSFPYPGTNGLYPKAKLLYSGGHLFSTTFEGGATSCSNGNGCGVVFALTPGKSGAWQYERLYAFQSGTDAQTPVGDLAVDSKGNLYGATQYGGENGFGAVYKLSNAGGSWSETVIYSFTNTPDGAYPGSGVTIDAAGNLYGTTAQGGSINYGTVYKLTAGSGGTWSESVIHNFAGVPDGRGPEAEVIFDASGNLYGTTEVGGSNNESGAGIVYELTPATGEWTESILYTFPNTSVGYPVAQLWMNSEGNLFGTGKSDGSMGSAFELSLADGSWSEATLFSFLGGYNGGEPYGGLVPDAEGNLYGTTDDGGGAHWGTIYKLTPGSNGEWTESVVHSFTGETKDGSYCAAGLTAGKPGTYYGVTYTGGTHNYGTVFEFTP
jgi:uncharacterized repeat protein (TIGR03803 family)